MSETNNQPQAEQTVVLVYDADAEQRLPFQVTRRGRLFNVAVIFGPNALKDKTLIEYDRCRDQRISDADAAESTEADAMAVTGKSFAPAVQLFDSTKARGEGYVSTVPDKDKAYAVNNLLLAVEFVTAPTAAADELCPADDGEEGTTHFLRCIFNGQLVTTEHTLRDDPDDLEEFQAIMSRALLVKGTQFGQTDQRIPSRAVRLGALYDKAKLEVKGYAGRVPLHHKQLVVHQHFKGGQKALVGNSNGSPRP